LLARIWASILRAVGKEKDEGVLSEKIDGIGALAVALERVLRDEKKVVLILDGVDRGRGAGGLVGALARMGDLVSLRQCHEGGMWCADESRFRVCLS
jgi:hypothetical protein